jgi:hypothetical protein
MNRPVTLTILRALRSSGEEPLPDASLRSVIRLAHPAERFTESDLTAHLRIAEERGYIAGASDALTGAHWTLTPKGKIHAAPL